MRVNQENSARLRARRISGVVIMHKSLRMLELLSLDVVASSARESSPGNNIFPATSEITRQQVTTGAIC
jgi:hypothetical protein